MQNITITQEMLDATGESIEQAVTQPDMLGIAFLQVTGGRWALYNLELKRALKVRFDNIQAARLFAIERIMMPVRKGATRG